MMSGHKPTTSLCMYCARVKCMKCPLIQGQYSMLFHTCISESSLSGLNPASLPTFALPGVVESRDG
jgi:hypothetical protein